MKIRCIPWLFALALVACGGGEVSNTDILCVDVTCSGRGQCVSDGLRAWCMCNEGFRAMGLECVPSTPDGDGDSDADGDGDGDGDSDADGDTDADTDEVEHVECMDEAFTFEGEPQVIEIPEHASYLHIKAWGAGGNSDAVSGGPGGYTEALFEIVGRPSLVAIVGRYGRNDGEWAYGFAGRGGGGLTGVFLGEPPIGPGDSDRAVVIAGGGGSAARDTTDIAFRGGPGNRREDECRNTVPPSMAGGDPTDISPGDRNLNTGGGGGYRGGQGRTSPSNAGCGGTGYVADALDDLILVENEDGIQSVIESYDWETGDPSETVHSDEDCYPSVDCPPSRPECDGYLCIRFLCQEPEEMPIAY